jgi:hypothetical protein
VILSAEMVSEKTESSAMTRIRSTAMGALAIALLKMALYVSKVYLFQSSSPMYVDATQR